jgi:hypothetical protein
MSLKPLAELIDDSLYSFGQIQSALGLPVGIPSRYEWLREPAKSPGESADGAG